MILPSCTVATAFGAIHDPEGVTTMLLSINPETGDTDKRRTLHLQSFGLYERALQGILFRSLDRLVPDDELLLLMQSRAWQEEPDLMAIDREGRLFLFELKAWESQASNLLQVLRYGQLFGSMGYSELDAWFKTSTDPSQSLKTAHRAKFEVELPEEAFNRKQAFVVMTNGLDYRTRESVQYWRSSGLDVRPWVYRVYAGVPDEMLLAMSPFRAGQSHHVFLIFEPLEAVFCGEIFGTSKSSVAR
jgi:hypothetical protein